MRRQPWTAWQDVLAADPDVLIVAPCGFSLERTWRALPTLAARPGWAVRAGRVFAVDGKRYFNRSGPSLFETPAVLAEMLHPQVVAPRHRESAWRTWPGAS